MGFFQTIFLSENRRFTDFFDSLRVNAPGSAGGIHSVNKGYMKKGKDMHGGS